MYLNLFEDGKYLSVTNMQGHKKSEKRQMLFHTTVKTGVLGLKKEVKINTYLMRV